jgi:hypothetical protein
MGRRWSSLFPAAGFPDDCSSDQRGVTYPRLTNLLVLVGSALLSVALANVTLWALNLADIEVYEHDPDLDTSRSPTSGRRHVARCFALTTSD